MDPPTASCSLYTHLTLPSALFIDKYQLSDTLFLQSHNLLSLRSLAGETDLEAPDWVISKWGSAALLELSNPSAGSASKQPGSRAEAARKPHEVTVPLHLRYLPPAANSSGLTPLAMPYPPVFWACPAPASSCDDIGGPFEPHGLVYDTMFLKCTVFYHVAPVPTSADARGELLASLQVPVLDLAYADWVEWGTLAAMVLGAAWVAWKLCLAAGLLGTGGTVTEDTDQRRIGSGTSRKDR